MESQEPSLEQGSSTSQEAKSPGDGVHIAEAFRERLKRFAEAAPDHAERAAAYEREQQRRELDERRNKWHEFVLRRGKRYGICRFDNFDAVTDEQRAAVKAVMDYSVMIADRITAGQNVILFGPPGTGKDHLTVAMSREAFRAGYTVAWANGQDLFSALRDAMKDEIPERRVISDFTCGDVLYLSDPLPPTGESRQYQQETLFRIIDRCYSDLKPVWATLNVKNRQEASERLGPQATDRLMHGALIVPCNWESARKPL